MPYAQDPHVLRRLISEVIATPDIRQRIEIAEVNEQRLTEFLEQSAPDIWAAAGPQIDPYNQAERDAATAAANCRKLEGQKPIYLKFVEDVLPVASGLFILSLFSLLSSTVRTFITTQAARINLPVALTITGTVLLVGYALWWIQRASFRRYRTDLAAAKTAIENAKQDAQTTRMAIEPAVSTVIAAHIGEYLDQVAPPAFRLDLPETDTAGYSEVHNHEFEIITDSRRYVRGLIEKMNGGSIGIAGPRGCGKTTLLRSFCQEGTVNARKLSLFATAPVQYDPREFLLQLFTQLCSRVTSKETRKDEQPAWTEMDSLREMSTPRLLDVGVFASLAMVLSVILLFTGMVMAIGQSDGTQSSTQAAKPTASAPPSSAPGTQTQQPAPSSPLNSPAVPYFIWGTAALVIGLTARFSSGQPLPDNPLDLFFGPWVLEHQRRKKEEEQKKEALKDVDPAAIGLVERARRTLRGLRFQQSYSSGWSGTLKLPVGIEGGANAAVSFAERQLGLPEVVHEYREFLRAAARRYDQILIAIDELDKLESDDAAKKFLNSIKAVFGQEKVYYLISISENAMSNFERRGLPIRDEFDSSFDDAVYIGYLDGGAARRLLARRATEPPPEVYRTFCYVASGGLPRDLIRYCRKVYDYRRSHAADPNDAAVICPAVIREDIRAKLEAMKHNLGRVPDERRTATILTLISETRWNQNTAATVIARLDEIQNQVNTEAAAYDAEEAGSEADLRALSNILEEITVFLRFSQTVAGAFESINGQARYQQLQTDLTFDRLARARQWMAVNRAAALETIAQVNPMPPQPPQPVQVQPPQAPQQSEPAVRQLFDIFGDAFRGALGSRSSSSRIEMAIRKLHASYICIASRLLGSSISHNPLGFAQYAQAMRAKQDGSTGRGGIRLVQVPPRRNPHVLRTSL